MRIGRKIDIDLTIQSFKRYLRSVLFQAKTDIESINRSCSLAPYEYDRYADAFYIVSKNGEFELTLNPNEYRAIRYFHYHNPIDAKPSDYDISFASAFKKWCAVFFPNQGKQYVDIDSKTLGAMMRLFRTRAGRSKTEMGKILGVDRTTIGFYEDGRRTPSINYIYRFCKYFHISMDELIEKCTE